MTTELSFEDIIQTLIKLTKEGNYANLQKYAFEVQDTFAELLQPYFENKTVLRTASIAKLVRNHGLILDKNIAGTFNKAFNSRHNPPAPTQKEIDRKRHLRQIQQEHNGHFLRKSPP